ncbi:hypothetical protein Y032_0250g146 [Ancylostoma ceylanicum]|uniref:Uncharacterized protein n=1 Tax=Ancylostoma ceylanicum TaxID=53326 RepID=A0A016SCY6_9BILA|nr:hypothetical protein Y032_0250g146 [Ancylostoma ceylanicum]
MCPLGVIRHAGHEYDIHFVPWCGFVRSASVYKMNAIFVISTQNNLLCRAWRDPEGECPLQLVQYEYRNITEMLQHAEQTSYS